MVVEHHVVVHGDGALQQALLESACSLDVKGNLLHNVLDNTEAADDWMAKGACKGLTHLFFPSPAERPQARERREATARQVCGSCSVRVACRDFARDAHEYGFWGGESEDERHSAGYRLIAPIGVRAKAVNQ